MAKPTTPCCPLLGAVLLLLSGTLCTSALAPPNPTPPPHPTTASSAPTHPLDPLTADEINQLKQILSAKGLFSDKDLYTWVQAIEPPKERPLTPGDAPPHRQALAVGISGAQKTGFELQVDLTAGQVIAQRWLGKLQPFFSTLEYEQATELLDASAPLKAAIEARGIQITGKISDQIFFDQYAPSRDASTDGNPTRLMRILFADRQGGQNNYGPHLEGLTALIDLYNHRILSITDTHGPTARGKVPHDVFNPEVRGSQTHPQSDDAPTGTSAPGFSLQGHHVQWGHWDFRFSFNQREGLVLHQIGRNDQGKIRSICYRASVSEMLVPYADPAPEWQWREFLDEGDYGLGTLSVQAQPGEHVPLNAATVDVVLASEALAPKTYAKRVFLYERSDGSPLCLFQQKAAAAYAPRKELCIGFVASLGNYQYLYRWVFRPDASFGFEADLQGETLNKTVVPQLCDVCSTPTASGAGQAVLPASDQRFGTIVYPEIDAVFHQHFCNLRLDFDIDGPQNAVEEVNVVRLPNDPAVNPQLRGYTLASTIFGKEGEAVRDDDATTNRSWVVYNPTQRSRTGHFAGYELVAGSTTFSPFQPSRFGDKTSFAHHAFWVTQYDPDELYASGRYPNQADDSYRDHLSNYVAKDRSIFQRDDVIWYTLGLTHLPRQEDYPLISGARISVNFVPHNFFERAPFLEHVQVDPHSNQE